MTTPSRLPGGGENLPPNRAGPSKVPPTIDPQIERLSLAPREDATSNNIDESMDLNAFLLKKDKYRFTIPALETSRSSSLGYLSNDHPLRSHATAISSIINRTASRRAFVVLRFEFIAYSSLHDPNDPFDHPLLSIQTRQANDTTMWQKAVEEIHAQVLQFDKLVYVELVSKSQRWYLSIEPVLNNAVGIPIQASWNAVKDQVIALLEQDFNQNGRQWSNVCVFMCLGREASHKRCGTILITMEYEAIANWFRSVRAIRNLLLKNSVTNLEVEFRYGALKFCALTQAEAFDETSTSLSVNEKIYPVRGNILPVTAIHDGMANGDSLGIVDDTNSGSIGGFVILDDSKHPGKPVPFLLTCHHVTRRKEKDRWDFLRPLKLSDSHLPKLKHLANSMRSPSPKEYESTMAFLKAKINKAQEVLRHLEGWNLGEHGHILTERRKKSLHEAANKAIADGKELMEVLKRREKPIGQTVASSGIHTRVFNEGGIQVRRKLDWALIALKDPSSVTAVRAPERNQFTNEQLGIKKEEPLYNPTIGHIVKTDSMKQGYEDDRGWVFMRGRTPGFSAGRVNSIHAIAKRIQGVSLATFEETVIVSWKSDEWPRSNQRFSAAGDSGSFIFDAKGNVVAMQLSETDATHGEEHITGAIPIDLVLQDIEESTQGTIRLCSQADEGYFASISRLEAGEPLDSCCFAPEVTRENIQSDKADDIRSSGIENWDRFVGSTKEHDG